MTEPSNGDIMQALGRLQGAFDSIGGRLDRADESRKGLSDAVAAQSRQIDAIKFAGEVTNGIIAQTREEVKGLHTEQKAMTDNIKPILDLKNELPAMVEVWRDMNKWSKRLVWVLGLGGIGTLGVLVWFGNAVIDGARHLLRIQ